METTMICMQGAKKLACAVIERAVQDYAAWYRLYLRDPGYRTADRECAALEEFFASSMFDLYATLAGRDWRGPEVAAGIRHSVRRRNSGRAQEHRPVPWQQENTMEEVI